MTTRAFTPVFSGLTLGNGSIAGAYGESIGMVFFEVQVELGSTSYLAPGVALTLEGLPPMGLGLVACFWTAMDVSAQARYVGQGWQFDRTCFALFAELFRPVGGAVPITWATKDTLWVQGHYTISTTEEQS